MQFYQSSKMKNIYLINDGDKNGRKLYRCLAGWDVITLKELA